MMVFPCFQVNQEARLEKLQKKHDIEKQQALLEITAVKTKMNEREVKISTEFQGKFDNLKREVDNMNKRFQEKIQQFESVNKVHYQDEDMTLSYTPLYSPLPTTHPTSPITNPLYSIPNLHFIIH
jgi:hypothetical protein